MTNPIDGARNARLAAFGSIERALAHSWFESPSKCRSVRISRSLGASSPMACLRSARQDLQQDDPELEVNGHVGPRLEEEAPFLRRDEGLLQDVIHGQDVCQLRVQSADGEPCQPFPVFKEGLRDVGWCRFVHVGSARDF